MFVASTTTYLRSIRWCLADCQITCVPMFAKKSCWRFGRSRSALRNYVAINLLCESLYPASARQILRLAGTLCRSTCRCATGAVGTTFYLTPQPCRITPAVFSPGFQLQSVNRKSRVDVPPASDGDCLLALLPAAMAPIARCPPLPAAAIPRRPTGQMP